MDHTSLLPPLHNVRFTKSGNNTIRSAPENLELCEVTYDSEGLPVHASALDSADQAEFGRCEAVARAVMAEVSGKVMTLKDVQNLTSYHLNRFGRGIQRKTLTGVYGGFPLFSIATHVSRRRVTMSPSTALANDMKGLPPDLAVRSFDRTRMLPAMDAANETYIKTGDAKKAWIAAAEKVQSANCDIADGVKSPLICQRANGEPHCDQDHHCAICGERAACKDLVVGRLSIPAHVQCDDRIDHRLVSTGKLGLAHAYFKCRMDTVIQNENRSQHGLSSTDENIRAIMRECEVQLKDRFKGVDQMSYYDGYRAKLQGRA